MASSSSSPIVIHIPPQTNNGEITAGTGPTTPKDAGAASTAAPVAATPAATDKVMSSVANLAQLLPTGTVLAYQALAPSFTNHGKCETSNQWLTVALVLVLTASCLFFAFTDSVLGRDQKLYYGVATLRGFNVFNFSTDEEKEAFGAEEFTKLRIRPLDFMHAFFTAVVFLTVAFSDVGLQNCFFPDAGKNTEELLKNLPLGMAFLSSFVFLVFPTKRKGIGYNDTTPRQKVK
jgi:FtsH-binding integral membrane protein